MGQVKIFCDCGREIWQEVEDSLTIRSIRTHAICSDCLARQSRESLSMKLARLGPDPEVEGKG